MSIQLKARGMVYEGWKSFSVTRSMDDLCGSFNINITDKNNAPYAFLKPNDSCQIWIDGTQVCNGYIDALNIQYSATSHGISIGGRDKAGDLVDSSIIIGTGEWKNLKAEALITAICLPFKIPVRCNINTGPIIPTFNIEQGMRGIDVIRKICAMRGCLAISDNNGGLLVTRAGAEMASTILVEGVNIKSASAMYNTTGRFSQYIVKGQQQGDDKTSTTRIRAAKAMVLDPMMAKRYRPTLIIADGQVDDAKAMIRAKWEAAVAAGKSRTFTVEVNGWKQSSGQLWKVNQKVMLRSPLLDVMDMLLITQVEYKLDTGGEMTTLTLADLDAYKLK